MLNGPAWSLKLRTEIAKAVIGQEAVVERLLVALLANGHVLLEGMPGLAKTLLIKSLGTALGGYGDLAAEFALQPPRPGNVIGVDVRLQGRDRVQVEFADQRHVALPVLEDGIDDDGRARDRIAEDVGVGGGSRIEQLSENHARTPVLVAAARGAGDPGRLRLPPASGQPRPAGCRVPTGGARA